MPVCIRCRQPPTNLRFQLRAASSVALDGLVDIDHCHVSALGGLGAGQIEPRRKPRNASSNPPGRSLPQQKWPLPDRVDESLQSLFASKQSEDSSSLRGLPSRTSHTRPYHKVTAQDSTDNDLDVLNRMLNEEKGPLKDFLQQCKDNFVIEARKPSADRFNARTDSTSSAGRDVFADILIRICRSRSRDPLRYNIVPTASDVIRIYRKYNVMNHRWHDILGIQIGALLESVHDPKSVGVTREISDNAAPIFEELLNCWAIYLEEQGNQQHTLDAGINCLATLDKTKDSWSKSRVSQPNSSAPPDLSKVEEKNPDHHMFKLSNQRMNIIAAAAIMTDKYLNLFLEKNTPVSTSTQSAKSFLRFSDSITKGNKPDHHVFQELSTCLVEYGTPLHIVDKALARCGMSPSIVRLLYGKGLATSSDKDITDGNKTWDSHQITSLMKQLNRAGDQSDRGLAVSVWKSFQKKPMREDVTESLRDRIFVRFIDVFFKLSRPKLAVQVWNLMVKSDLVPKQKHWHAMMVGSRKTKDLASMQACWSQMKAFGIEPDLQSWTAWIHGLIICGEWQRGIGALEELGRLWKTAPKLVDSNNGETHRLVPSIEPVNAAISAVLAVKKPNIVPSIFKWAKLQKIPLDISTFNIMLKSAITKDQTERVDQLLSEMKLHNCQPDIITFTTMLEGLLKQPKSSFRVQKPEAQQATIFNLLTTLQQRGLCITAHTYSTILSTLLAPETVNITAARAVLNHMIENKVQPSIQIYTTFMRYYFNATPPNHTAIDSLWRHIWHHRDIADSVFFNRMIEWYAHVEEVERMFKIARNMSEKGKSPSWSALLAMLKALVRARESDLANELIKDLSDPKRGLLRYYDGVEMKDREVFWDLVTTLMEQGWLKLKEKKK